MIGLLGGYWGGIGIILLIDLDNQNWWWFWDDVWYQYFRWWWFDFFWKTIYNWAGYWVWFCRLILMIVGWPLIATSETDHCTHSSITSTLHPLHMTVIVMTIRVMWKHYCTYVEAHGNHLLAAWTWIWNNFEFVWQTCCSISQQIFHLDCHQNYAKLVQLFCLPI